MKRPEIVIGLLIIVLLLSMLASLASGAVSIAPADVVQALFAWTGQSDVAATEQMIVEQIRLPRTLMGAIIGATLGLTGAAMQGLFRNPLADPGLIGVSGGAALGAALIIVLGSGFGRRAAWRPGTVSDGTWRVRRWRPQHRAGLSAG